jgi:hypothetical protein
VHEGVSTWRLGGHEPPVQGRAFVLDPALTGDSNDPIAPVAATRVAAELFPLAKAKPRAKAKAKLTKTRVKRASAAPTIVPAIPSSVPRRRLNRKTRIVGDVVEAAAEHDNLFEEVFGNDAPSVDVD